MSTVSGSIHITGIVDGDQISGQLRATLPLVQYIKKDTSQCSPDFVAQPTMQPIIYPNVTSQYEQRRLPVLSGTEKWFYNSESIELTFDANGLCTGPGSAAGKFRKVIYNNGDFNVPGLKIVGNLASDTNKDSDVISMEGAVESAGHTLPFRLDITFRIEEIEGDPYIGYINDESGTGAVLDDNTPSITLKAYLMKSGSLVTSGITYQWQKIVNGVWTNISGATSQTLVVTKADIEATELRQVKMTVNGTIVYAQIEVNDETDPRVINWNASGSTKLTRTINSVTLTPKVVRRDSGVEDTSFTGKPFTFNIFNAKGESYTPLTSPTSSSVTITYDDVKAAFMDIAIYGTVSN